MDHKTPQRSIIRSLYKAKTASHHDIGKIISQPTHLSPRIEFEANHQTDFGSGLTYTRHPTLKTAQPGIRTPDILLSQPLSARKQVISPSLSTADNLLSVKRDNALSRAGLTPEVKPQVEVRAQSTLRGAQSDFQSNDFYLTTRSDSKQFKIKQLRPSSLTSHDFQNLTSPRIQTPGPGAGEASITAKIKNSNFYDTLPPSMRDFYADKKEFSKIFEDYAVAEFCLSEVTAKVKCYRVELGILLDKALDTHRKLYEKTLDTAMKLFLHQESIIEKKLQEIRENVRQIEVEKQVLEEKNKNFKNLLNIAEASSRVQSLNIEKLQNEIKIAHEVNKQEIMEKLNENPKNEEFLPDKSRGSTKKGYTERLQEDIANLQEFFEELDREHINKTKIIKDMSNHLKAALKKTKYDATTQVDEVELAWTAKNIQSAGGDSIKKADLFAIESSTVNIEEKLKSKTSELEKNPSFEPGDILKLKDKEIKEQMEGKSVLLEGRRRQTVMGQNMVQDLDSTWNLPLNIIVFLENVTKSGAEAKVLPWEYFRKKIMEIYKDRIRNRTEVENSLINTFIPFSEYICLYFLKEYKLRRTAEMKLLEFLVSLKYYVRIWPRAQIFASMCNILGTLRGKDYQDALNVNEYDIYLQNYVLYAYEHTFSEANSLVEHSEGTTLIPKEKLEDIVHRVLIFEPELNRKRFWVNLQSQYQVIGEGPEKDNEGIDADRVVLAFIEGYVEAKRRNLKAITKYYYKNNQDPEKILSIEDFASAVAEVNEVEPAVANQVYPKDLTLCRSFLYALTSGNNTYAVTFKQMVGGLARFGMDCPFPFISLGNDERKSKEYLNGGLAGDLFKKKNQQLKKRGAIFQDKRRFADTRTNDTNRENDSSPSALKNFEASNQKTFKKELDGKAVHGLKLDSASALFAQQFAVLRELNNYCKQFSEVVESGDQEFETMMKSFRQIAQILETGCEFLKFPINIY